MLKIAFAGNPNVGKTAIINKMAGSNLKVGNWPGVTVERKEAEFEYKGKKIQLIDLPGVYSLSPYSLEEIITRDYILEEEPDVVINVVDSTNLERNLYLTTLLQELGKPMVISLNLYDEFEKLEYKLNMEKFQNYLNIDVVPTSAVSGKGIYELLDKAIEVAEKKKVQHHTKYKLRFSEEIEKKLKSVICKLEKDENIEKIKGKYSIEYCAIKLLEEDKHFLKTVKDKYKVDLSNYAKEERFYLEGLFDEETEIVLSEGRYAVIKGIIADTLTTSLKNRLDFTEKVDKILLNKFFGLIIFCIIMFGVFTVTFNGSAPFIEWVDGFIGNYVGKYVGMFVEGTPNWLNALVMDGIIGGVGGVVVFIPLMLFLYFFLALLEESGYMSRVAFLMDKIMRKVGLNGKAFVPLILGFGCSVPAIYATRMLDDEKSRRLTAVMVPFMSCGARLPVYALFTAAFFGKSAGLIVLSLYILGIVVAICVGLIFKRIPYFRAEEKALLIELPPYRIPSFKMIWTSSIKKTGEYIKKATTVIMGVLLLLWVLIYFPNQGDAQNSILAKSSKVIKPILKPVGFADRWETVAAIPPSIAAKEVVVGFMGQVLQIDEVNEELGQEVEAEEKTGFLQDTGQQVKNFVVATKDSIISMVSFNITGLFTPPGADEIEDEKKGIITATAKLWGDNPKAPLKAYSFMVFILLVVPCVVTLAAVKQELGIKMMWIVVAVMIAVPYIVSTLIYQIGNLLIY